MNPLSSIKSLDFNSKQTKLILAFIVPGIVFFILSPGILFEITPPSTVERTNKIRYSSGGVHAVIFAAVMFAFYYFYLLKCTKTE